MARVSMCIGSRKWTGDVALVSGRDLDGKGILAINLRDQDSWNIVNEFRGKVQGVNVVETRSGKKEREQVELEDSKCVIEENAGSTSIVMDEEVENVECTDEDDEEVLEISDSDIVKVAAEGGVGEVDVALDIPIVNEGNDRDLFVKEVKDDQSLKALRELANNKERGYYWDNELLMQRISDHAYGIIETIVVPKSRRLKVMSLAHDRSGHLGHKKVGIIVKRNFVWPLMNTDIRKYCESCQVCQRVNKRGQANVGMVERPIVTQPFEQIALDLVGPLPKGKGGARFVLTAACMATRWPYAIALKSITAKSVAEATIEIFSRMGLPHQILTDRGTQFTSALAKQMSSLLGIEKLLTTAYHPQSNGVLERLHSTLEAMLGKAHALGLDWVRQLPFVLFALRQAPNRTTGYSPFELVYGHNVRTPLDVVYGNVGDVLPHRSPL